MAPRRKWPHSESSSTDLDASEIDDYESDGFVVKAPKKKKTTSTSKGKARVLLSEEEDKAETEEEEEADSHETSEDETEKEAEDSDTWFSGRAKKLKLTMDAATIGASIDATTPTVFALPRKPRRRRGTGNGRRRTRDEDSINKEWCKWRDEMEREMDSENEEEYEEKKRKLALSMEKHETPAEFVFPLLPFQAEFLSWGMNQELSPFKGGMLADEMGMGKTIQAISLILGGRAAGHGHDKDETDEQTVDGIGVVPWEDDEELVKVNATLVVCPVVAVEQWKSEIERFTTEGSLKVLIYHGTSRKKIELEELAEYDVVLSTYSIIEHDFRKMLPDKLRCKYCQKPYTKQGLQRHLKYYCGPFAVKKDKSKAESGKKKRGAKRKKPVSQATLENACKEAKKIVLDGSSLLHSVKWVRIILDEAHTIKERQSNTAKAVFALDACYRWLLSGTPLQNRVGELNSLIRFLRVGPCSYFFCTRCDCKTLDFQLQCESCDHAGTCHMSWWNKFIARPIQEHGFQSEGGKSMNLLRRKLLDQMLLRRTKTERAADLIIPPKTLVVRKVCFDKEEDSFYEALYKQSVSAFGTFVEEGTVLKNYAHIFDLLTRLRQAVDHPYLITKSTTANICGVCHNPCEEAVAAKCGDTFCKVCLEEALEKENKPCPKCDCPLARLETKTKTKTKAKARTNLVEKKVVGYKKNSIIHRVDLSTFRTSTKIEALKEEVNRMIARDPSAKALVFSQFTSMLDLIHYSFDLVGIKTVKMDGSMGLAQRVSIIDKFRNDPECKIFLMSLKAGGVALNLTVASQIFIMDPWWNPAIEHQAQDRIHRIGQCKPIRVIRFVIERSIEERILKLQEKKQLVFDATIGGSSDALGKLTEKDLKFLFAPH